MRLIVAQGAVIVLLILLLFSSCGDMEILVPSSGSYQIKTLVNDISLDDCGIVRHNDKIRPFFAVSVDNDPDLIGILIYLQNSLGEAAGEKVRYVLEEYAEKPIPIKDDETAEEETAEKPKRVRQSLTKQGAFTETQTVPQDAYIEIAIKSFAEELPYFPLPQNLETGSYTLVFEALGKKETLAHIENHIFYLGNAQFSLKDISMYLPGVSGSQLISPGTTIMLETRLEFDNALDPYVIWYNGRSIISEGKMRDGAGIILWTVPEQDGFYSIRMEAFPFQFGRKFSGVNREIVLPVSPKAENMGYFFEDNLDYTSRNPLAASLKTEENDNTETPAAPQLLQWYQFKGNLHNALMEEQSLVPAEEHSPRWAAAGQSYGLSIETEEVYLLPPVNFFSGEQEQGGGIFLFHIKPPSEGTVLSAFFPSQSSAADGAWISVIKNENVITLRLNAGSAVVEMPVHISSLGPQELIPFVVEFYIRSYRIEARISPVMEYSPQNKAESIKLPGALSGEGKISLGGPKLSPTESKPVSPKSADDGEYSLTEQYSAETELTSAVIWDEMAILSSAEPLMPEELFDTAIIEELVIDGTGDADENSTASAVDSMQEREIPVILPDNL